VPIIIKAKAAIETILFFILVSIYNCNLFDFK
jgi:hypothetical protein